MINRKPVSLALLFAFAASLPVAAYSADQGANKIRLQTSASKRNNETAFSTMVAWRKDQGRVNKANGLSFVLGSKAKNPPNDVEVARKITRALSGGINYEAPHERGAIAEFKKGRPEMLVSNKQGFDLIRFTSRDYTNQTLSYDIPGKTFNQAGVDVAIDLVYSAAVEYIDNFASAISLKPAGGYITVTLDDKQPIKIKTDDKTTSQLEKELAQAIGSSASYSLTPIYPNFTQLRSRNYKEFDGGEVQLPRLKAKSLSIDIDDPGLGVLTKFSFPDVNKDNNESNSLTYLIALLVAAALGFVFYRKKTN